MRCHSTTRFDTRRSSARAFTLTELLTVIAIIALLGSILLPVMSAARRKAKEAKTRVLINSLVVACENFKSDQNEYPQSNPAWYGNGSAAAQANWEVTSTAGQPLSGANLLVDCLTGRDGNGFDAKVGTGPGTSSSSRYYFSAAAGDVPRQRRATYLASNFKFSDRGDRKPRDGLGEFTNLNEVMPVCDANDNPVDGVPVFMDDFDFPILYYRANPGARPQMRIMQLTSETAVTTKGSGIYDGRDNAVFTNHVVNGKTHKIDQADDGVAASEPAGGYTNNFAQFIRSRRTSGKDSAGRVNFSRPINDGSFIILSPGKDGIWGTADDIGNFDSDNK